MFTARRRSQLTAGAAFLLAVVLLGACDWPQSRYGPERTGFNPFESTINPTNVSGLQSRWSQFLVDGRAIEAPPTIAAGVLYARSDKLYAFDASTGSARWSSSGIGFGLSSPAVANGVVYVSGDKLYALNATTGAQLWSAGTGLGGGSPAVANGVVYVSGDKLYALNATTGAQLWSAGTGLGGGSPAVANGVVYVSGDKLYALNATTGAQLWSAGTGLGGGSPAVANGVVYVSGDKLYALNATTGAQLWSAGTGLGGGSPAVANGVVYVSGDKLYALNATTGAQLWSAGPGLGGGSPAVANGVVYVSGDKSWGLYAILAFDAKTGAQLGSPAAYTDSASPLVVANGFVYFSSNGLNAYSLPMTTPQLSISPAFPGDYVLPDTPLKGFRITNIGSVTTSPITDSFAGPDAAQFQIHLDGCTGTRLAAGASCNVFVYFAPTRSGPLTARLMSTADAGGTASAMLAGTGPPFGVSPFSKHFGFPFAGSTSAAAFTVTNFGGVPLGPITNSVTAGSGFTITTDACSGTMIAVGASCTVSVKFAPTAVGDYSGQLITRAAGYQSGVALSGSGLVQLAVAPSSKDFGSVRAGTTAKASFTVTNVSPSAAGPITDAIENPNWFSITSDTCAGRTLAGNSSCTVAVTFAPTGTGTDPGGILKIDAPSGGVNAGLYGAGT